MNKEDLRILYITQKVDKDDNLLHPFYKWMNLIAAQTKKVTTICLKEGRHENLAANITIKSLGKEKGVSKLSYLKNLYKYTWQLFKKKEVDVLFVHMNEIYILLLWPLCLLFKIPIVWWKAHGHLSWKSRLAISMVKKIATSSETGFPVDTPKRNILSQGVDTQYFSFKDSFNEKVSKIIWVGRISPIKDIETLIRAADVLINQKGHNLIFNVIGSVPLKEQEIYFSVLKKQVANSNLEGKVNFLGSIPHEEIVRTYKEADIFVNTGNTRSLDKTVLEAMSVGTIVINSNIGYQEILKDCSFCQFEQSNDTQLVKYIEEVMKMSLEERKQWGMKLRQIVVNDHNMVNLVDKLIGLFVKASK